MKPNIIFLIVGLCLSIISKAYQFKIKSQAYIGNIIVIPAAICLCLAVLFSIKKFNTMYFTPATQPRAVLLAALAYGTVVSFQLMMILLIGNKSLYGLIFAFPFIAAMILFLINWF